MCFSILHVLGVNAVLFYLTGYTFMTLGAFGVLAFLERKEGGPEAERFGGEQNDRHEASPAPDVR